MIIRVGFGVDDRKVRRGLRKMELHRKRLGKVFRQLRPVLRQDLFKHAEAEESPSGRPWPARAPATMAKVMGRASSARTADPILTARGRRRRKGGGRFAGPLRAKHMTNMLGKLPLTVTTTAGKAQLRARSTVKWSGVHNEGGVVGHGAHIPEREFVGLSPEILARASTMFADFVHEGWRTA